MGNHNGRSWNSSLTPELRSLWPHEGVIPWIQTCESEGCRRGQTYLNASGEKLPNMGEEELGLVTPDGSWARATFQVAAMNRPLCAAPALPNALRARAPCCRGPGTRTAGAPSSSPAPYTRSRAATPAPRGPAPRPAHRHGAAPTPRAPAAAPARRGPRHGPPRRRGPWPRAWRARGALALGRGGRRGPAANPLATACAMLARTQTQHGDGATHRARTANQPLATHRPPAGALPPQPCGGCPLAAAHRTPLPPVRRRPPAFPPLASARRRSLADRPTRHSPAQARPPALRARPTFAIRSTLSNRRLAANRSPPSPPRNSSWDRHTLWSRRMLRGCDVPRGRHKLSCRRTPWGRHMPWGRGKPSGRCHKTTVVSQPRVMGSPLAP